MFFFFMQEAIHKTQRLTVPLKKVGYTIIRANFIIKADANNHLYFGV